MRSTYHKERCKEMLLEQGDEISGCTDEEILERTWNLHSLSISTLDCPMNKRPLLPTLAFSQVTTLRDLHLNPINVRGVYGDGTDARLQPLNPFTGLFCAARVAPHCAAWLQANKPDGCAAGTALGQMTLGDPVHNTTSTWYT
eukprot:TRINITY_DN42854_c0_g1_i2.p1 TRINITY_DN42854_c0_g1~~TRINITY_DN42854_c0_g1_i2.p1  ORF type:complete len:143 (-),score=4.60 TRINITY_DN42854_c0_g1_i2:111-539(-)